MEKVAQKYFCMIMPVVWKFLDKDAVQKGNYAQSIWNGKWGIQEWCHYKPGKLCLPSASGVSKHPTHFPQLVMFSCRHTRTSYSVWDWRPVISTFVTFSWNVEMEKISTKRGEGRNRQKEVQIIYKRRKMRHGASKSEEVRYGRWEIRMRTNGGRVEKKWRAERSIHKRKRTGEVGDTIHVLCLKIWLSNFVNK